MAVTKVEHFFEMAMCFAKKNFHFQIFSFLCSPRCLENV